MNLRQKPKRETGLTLVDRIVSYFSPVKGLERSRARRLLASASYWSADTGRRGTRHWRPSAGAATQDVNDDLPTLREQSRDLVRNNPIAAGAIELKVGSVVGAGLACAPDPDREEVGITEDQKADLVRRLAAEWRQHAEDRSFSACGQMTAHEVAELAYRSMLESGDVIVVRRIIGGRLCWQLVEGDRLCNNGGARDGGAGEVGKMYGGVEVGTNGEPLAYWITRDHPGLYNSESRQWDRVVASDAMGLPQVIHLYRRKRPGQTRGTPDLAPIIETLHKLGKFCDAELDAAVTGSFLSLAVTSETGEGLSTNNPSLDPEETAAEEDEVVLGPNEVFYLRPGEKVEPIRAEHPSDLFDPFVQALLRQIGAALNVPFEVLVKHFQSSYSASRAAILDAWRHFLRERAFVADRLYSTWYEALVVWLVADDVIEYGATLTDRRFRRALCRVAWAGTSVPQLDPVDEVTAARKRIELGISSRTIETAQLTGRDWDAVILQSAGEIKRMIELGMDPFSELVPESVKTSSQVTTQPPPLQIERQKVEEQEQDKGDVDED